MSDTSMNQSIKEAISDIIAEVQLSYMYINGRVVGKFVSAILTGDMQTAKIEWNCRLRDRLSCTSMDTLTLQVIDDYLELY